MKNLDIKSNPEVKTVFDNYPDEVKKQMHALRELVLETASENDAIETIEETLKWGEPSYLTKHGSTVRMDWKPKNPDQYAIYFKCTSRLVETFKQVFNGTFNYESTRAIVFKLNDEVPKEALKMCINAALRYHKVKHLATLGI
jgi:hemoglobin-like flavoprotein